ncbi:MAG: D-alanine--D-alanine ligase, partial [Methylococcales bacterium]|nr:D-alanine--D-alanine ligase [Methylococcales bacterium]
MKVENPKKFGRVGVLMGGCAAEKEISRQSGTAVFEALKRQNVEVVAIDVGDNPFLALKDKALDRVFNIIHGRGGEDGVLQSVLEIMKLPYTGSGVLASALTMDKLKTKLCWQGMGLPTPLWCLLRNEQDINLCIEKLGFPVIVKPTKEGSSMGMNKANNAAELLAAFTEASQFNCDVYAESWVMGNEYTVAILQGMVLPVIRLETANAFYDYQAKYESQTTQYHCPCGLSEVQEQSLQSLALKAYDGVDVKGWGRVDLFIDNDNKPQLIEVNTVPGMTSHSLVPMAAAQNNIDFDCLVWKILETS